MIQKTINHIKYFLRRNQVGIKFSADPEIDCRESKIKKMFKGLALKLKITWH